ncbi:MAG: NADH oxidase [Sphingomonas sp.]|nr:NADH oxidase [Sphingomonas sp.]
MSFTSREIRSTIGANHSLALSLATQPVGDPADDEVIVRIEAAPLNPSDIGLMLGPAKISTMRADGSGLVFDLPSDGLDGLAARIDKPIPIGTEAAGTVVAAGANARALEGRVVGLWGGGMYADYRRIAASAVVPLPDGMRAADGAGMFVNPMTALGFVETARRGGHRAMVHTAAASNLGQMLQKICLADDITLVNIVRSRSQEALMHDIGATLVLNSSEDDFTERLTDMLAKTGATVAFDAIGGGTLGGAILRAMERAAARDMREYSRYGSGLFKQLYIYGNLDPGQTLLDRTSLGYDWSVSGWLLMPFLRAAGASVIAQMQARIIRERSTIFASSFSREIGLAEALTPEILRAFERRSTGDKFLINPTLDR